MEQQEPLRPICLRPEEAAEELGMTVAEVFSVLPHLRVGPRIRRFDRRYVDSYRLFGLPGRVEVIPNLTPEDLAAGRIYFIEAVGSERVKIGFTTKDPTVRLHDLQTASPYPLSLLVHLGGNLKVEHELHRVFRRDRIMPKAEWFHATPALRGFIARAIRTGSWK